MNEPINLRQNTPLLDQIHTPQDLRKLESERLNQVVD